MAIKVRVQDQQKIGISSSGLVNAVKQVNSGNGLIGGPIVSAGTLSVNAQDGLISNSNGLFLNTSTIQIITDSSYSNSLAYTNTTNSFLLSVIAGANVAVGAGANAYTNTSISNLSNTINSVIANISSIDYFTFDSTNNTLIIDTNNGAFTSNINTLATISIIGDLTVTGNQTYIQSNTFLVDDNFVILNAGMNDEVPDIGVIGYYTDAQSLNWGSDTVTWGSESVAWDVANAYTGIIRDGSDGRWKVFNSYQPNPNANSEIDTANNTFVLADFQTATLYANAISANGSTGTAGQVLHSDGTSIYWGTDDVNTPAGNNTEIQFNNSGSFGSSNGLTFDSALQLLSVGSIGIGSNTISFGANGLSFSNGSSNSIFIDANGNIGFGTNSPSVKLDIIGDISISGGLKANGSLGTSGQVLTSNGTVSYWNTPTSTFADLTDTPSSFENYGSYLLQVKSDESGLQFTDTLSITNIQMDDLKYIAQLAPSDGTIAEHTLYSYVTSIGVDPNREVSLKLKNEKNKELVIGGFGNTYSFFGPVSSQSLSLITDSQSRIWISNTGNVGIGNTSPSDKLVVDGTIKTTGLKANNSLGSNNQVLTSNGSSVHWNDPTFNNLTDTPSSFENYGSYLVQVNSSETGLQYVDEINIEEVQMDTMEYVAQLAPPDGTIDYDTLAIYVTASGVSPNREIALKVKAQNNEEIILASILV